MEEPSIIRYLTDPVLIGGALGGLFMAIKILFNFDTKKVLKQYHKDDNSDNPRDTNSSNINISCPISKDQCEIFRKQLEQKVDIEIRSKLLELKIDIQRFITEEISRSQVSTRTPSEISRDIDVIFRNYIEQKYGKDKHVLK